MRQIQCTICIKVLREFDRRFRLRRHQYADKTQLYLTSHSDPKGTVEILNWCPEEVTEWMRASKLQLTHDKMDVLLVGSNLTLGSSVIPMQDKIAVPLKAQLGGSSSIPLC